MDFSHIFFAKGDTFRFGARTVPDGLEDRSIFIIREAYQQYKGRIGALWSMGKDSTTLLHLIRKSFFGDVPMPVIHIDTTFKFREIYEFRDKYAKEWGLNLIVTKNEDAIKEGMSPQRGRFDCCNALKTEALKQTIQRLGLKALLLGIRRDEHSIRAKERCFSPRKTDFTWAYHDQPLEMWEQFYQVAPGNDEHIRIHPMLGWSEMDVWEYIKKESLPVVDLYFSRHGKRYRSIGCACCCEPVASNADSVDKIIRELRQTKVSERSGRAQDKEKEYMMQKLRSLGYM